MLLTLAACALADPKQRGRDGRAAVFLVLGLKPCALRVGAALSRLPSSRSPPSKTLSKQREAALVARNTMCSNQSRRLAEIGRDSAEISSMNIIDGTLTKFVEMLCSIIAPQVD